MSKRILYPLFLLLIPLVGMTLTDKINWSLFDFFLMATLLIILGIGVDFVFNRTKKRILFLGILIVLFLLLWAELAVGLLEALYATPDYE
jgi:hypothetical protein